MNSYRLVRQRGVALAVMLIILVVLLVGSLYMMKASTTTTLITANLAYDSALSKAADFGLHTGAQWLAANATPANKAILLADNPGNGYVATFDPLTPPTSPNFWSGSVTVTDTTSAQNTVEYVIHRMCSTVGKFDAKGPPPNTCVQTTAAAGVGSGVAAGESLSSDASPLPGPPQIHYVITARILGARGGHVINQMVVMAGA